MISKIATQIFNEAVEEQRKCPMGFVNVGKHLNRNKHNLEAVKELASAKIRQQNRYIKYNIGKKEDMIAEIAILNQLIKSCDYVIETVL